MSQYVGYSGSELETRCVLSWYEHLCCWCCCCCCVADPVVHVLAFLGNWAGEGGRVKEYMYIDVHVPKVTPQLMYMHVVLLCMYINNRI